MTKPASFPFRRDSIRRSFHFFTPSHQKIIQLVLHRLCLLLPVSCLVLLVFSLISYPRVMSVCTRNGSQARTMMIVLLAAASSFNGEASTVLEEDFSSNATNVGAGWSVMTGTDVRFHEHFEGRSGVLEISAEKSFVCSHVMYQFETEPNRLHYVFLLSHHAVA